MEKPQNFVTTSELAKMLGISRVAALKWVKKMETQGVKVTAKGKSLLVDKASLPADLLDRWKETQEKAATAMKEVVHRGGKDLNFEKELWNAADQLRGNIDSSDYKHVVLGLLFLKYVSDSFYQRREELEKKTADPNDKEFFITEEADRTLVIEDKDQYRSKDVFYIPQIARWDFLRDHATHSDIGKYIDDARRPSKVKIRL